MLTLKTSVAAAILAGHRSALGRRGLCRDQGGHTNQRRSELPDARCTISGKPQRATRRSATPNRSGAQVVKGRRVLLIGGIALTLALMFVNAAQAQSANVLDQIVAQFQSRSAGWESGLRSFALNTFGILAAIELAWTAFKLAFRGSDVSEWLAEIVNQILFLGFFLALLQNSVTWGTAIVTSFRQAAGVSGGTALAPSDVFAAGVNLAQKVISQITIWSPSTSVGLIIAGLVIEVCFALIAAFMVLALVESYL